MAPRAATLLALAALHCLVSASRGAAGSAGSAGAEPGWCYGQAWCSALRLPQPDERDKDSWPAGVAALAYARGRDRLGELRALLADNATGPDSAVDIVAAHGLYPITVRRNTPFQAGHGRRVVDVDGQPLGSGPAPAFASPSVDVDILEGRTLALPCRIVNPGVHLVMWSRTARPPETDAASGATPGATPWPGDAMLVVGTSPTSPGRYSADANGTLYVHGVLQSDSGTYACRLGMLRDFVQTYRVTVLAQAKLENQTAAPTRLEIAWRGKHSLHCRVSGYPKPAVTWFKRGLRGALLDAPSHRYMIRSATRDDAGQYVCTAYNGILDRLLWTFDVVVQHPPEFECYDENNGARGDYQPRDVTIVCLVRAHPSATAVEVRGPSQAHGRVVASRGGAGGAQPGRLRVQASEDFRTFTLSVVAAAAEDLGVFAIRVNNTVGTSSLNYNLTDHTQPLRARVVDDDADAELIHVLLEYASNLPPTDLYFLYRLREDEDPEHYELVYDRKGQVVPPGPARKHAAEYNGFERVARSRPAELLRVPIRRAALEADATYDAIAQLKNGLAWSGAHQFRFHAGPGGLVRMVLGTRARATPVAASTSARAAAAARASAWLLALLLSPILAARTL